MGGKTEQLVTCEVANGVAVLSLNRPHRRNALSAALIEALTDQLSSLTKTARVIVLTGSGATFCAGGDLAGGLSNESGAVGAHEARAAFGRLFEVMRAHPAILLAAVNGDALGGGLGVAVCCDLVVADPEARFGTPEIRLGLFPWVILAVLNRHVGPKRLMEMVMLGQKVSALEAQSMGLVNRISESGEVLSAARELAAELALKAPIPLRLGKAAFYEVADRGFEDSLRYLNSQLTLNLMTEDAMEGVAAFMQRREPTWKGR
jgi:enoyl-CoA hydratase